MPFEFVAGPALFVLVIIVFAVIYLIVSVTPVKQGFEFTIERFGRYTRTLPPGLHFIFPPFDRVGAKIVGGQRGRHIVDGDNDYIRFCDVAVCADHAPLNPVRNPLKTPAAIVNTL